MTLWKHTPRDAFLLALCIVQVGATFGLAAAWDGASMPIRVLGFALTVLSMAYNIIIVSHLFTHAAWFESARLNAWCSALNSINAGQSIQAYQLSHVRNHHRYNNDRKGPDGQTKDRSSTFQDGESGEHASLFRYAVIGALSSLVSTAKMLASCVRLFRVGEGEGDLLQLAAKEPDRRRKELGQIRMDRCVHFLALSAWLVISWRWTLFCYLPAFFCALALVNVQNYYEHFGAAPESRYTDSVSHYGRLYNALTFNDGFHQEHHLRPQAHWTEMPRIREKHAAKLAVPRIVSKVPAIVGFLDRRRPLLHRQS